MGNKRGESFIADYSLQFMLCIIHFFLLCFLFLPFCSAEDTITSKSSLLTEGDTLVSSGQIFVLGFFTPSEDYIAGKKYVGIWYKNYPKEVVWVANRDDPIGPDTSGFFGIVNGNLKVVDGSGKVCWYANYVPSSQVSFPRSAKLMDTGNLVLHDENPDDHPFNILWQSFSNPTDTFLPGMKMDLNLALTSWKAADDPATGTFTFKQDEDDLIILNQSTPHWRSGKSANLFGPNDVPETVSQLLSNFNSTVENQTIYKNMRLQINFQGQIQALDWVAPRDSCDEYRFCGKFGSCNSNNLVTCKCLPGFVPSAPANWKSGVFQDGCNRKSPVGKNNTLLTLKMMKVGMIESDFEEANNADECRERCLSNLQCEAYAYKNISSRSRLDATGTCWIWSEEIYNLQEEYDDSAPDIYIRVEKSDIEPTRRSCGTCGTYTIPYPLSTGQDCGEPIYSSFNCKNLTGQVMFHSPSGSYKVATINEDDQTFIIQTEARVCELRTSYLRVPLHFVINTLCYSSPTVIGTDGTLKAAMISWELPMEPTCESPDVCSDWPNSSCRVASDGTKRCLCKTGFQWNASTVSCIQEGGFGNSLDGSPPEPLKKSSSQTNLLALILVGIPSGAVAVVMILGIFIFWKRRVQGQETVQGNQALSLYDSERRVKEFIESGQFKEGDKKDIDAPFVHLGTILAATDHFSDENKLGQGGFGPVYKGKFPEGLEIAVKRLSSGSSQGLGEFKNEVVLIAKLQHRNLVRLLGYCIEGDEKILLYEYMPNKSLDSFLFEYALDGIFSVKSDVFSFGVVLLEIISGKRNSGFYQSSQTMSLLGYAWRLWEEQKALDLMDRILLESCDSAEVMRCINVGLLCVQDDPSDRPLMLNVVFMLSNEFATLPKPEQPAFLLRRTPSNSASSSTRPDTMNQYTNSEEDGR
ncbi:Bulb-type lectin domain [Dillenia turbinata]|uniref:Bulb-type lectin domain n=1 Tax=Dillenia turbinata TaxID=194707 RepID=A0AAN8UNV6_9MAGN